MNEKKYAPPGAVYVTFTDKSDEIYNAPDDVFVEEGVLMIRWEDPKSTNGIRSFGIPLTSIQFFYTTDSPE